MKTYTVVNVSRGSQLVPVLAVVPADGISPATLEWCGCPQPTTYEVARQWAEQQSEGRAVYDGREDVR